MDNQPITSSRLVAEKFGKEHKNVLQAISKLDCSAKFNGLNFNLDAKGEKRPEVEMTRDGFTFLVMGFTGKEAAHFKEQYIEAFNQMEKQLKQPTITPVPTLPTNLKEALYLAYQQQCEIEQLKPKADYTDLIEALFR
ncbi:unnamed protein product [Darwinula stevensoni]|uniref:Uncharacterized protein n=1 Tax=Darwinula stevensoni TaxID=69355 RepID=A0A7R8XG43_9CRUS|nr:unnamed protein product [Darwinula stevensoni]CAG0896120.1 unnamed protein product [Darwinula stevensoni]